MAKMGLLNGYSEPAKTNLATAIQPELNPREIKNKLALEKYRADYNDLCWIRRGIINDLYKIMLENGAFGETKELSVPQQRKGLGSFLNSFYNFFKKN